MRASPAATDREATEHARIMRLVGLTVGFATAGVAVVGFVPLVAVPFFVCAATAGLVVERYGKPREDRVVAQNIPAFVRLVGLGVRPRMWQLVAAIVTGAVVYLLGGEVVSLLEPDFTVGASVAHDQAMVAGSSGLGPQLWWWFVFAALGPITEELWFRGLAQGAIVSIGGRWVWMAVPVVAGLFALMHVSEYDAVGVLVIFILGLTTCAARTITRSVAPSILIHVTYNVLVNCALVGVIHF